MMWVVRFSDGVEMKFDASETSFKAQEGDFEIEYEYQCTNPSMLILKHASDFVGIHGVSYFVGRCFVAVYHVIKRLFPSVTYFKYRNGAQNDEFDESQIDELEDAWQEEDEDVVMRICRDAAWRSLYYERIGFTTEGGTVDERLHRKLEVFMQSMECDTEIMDVYWDKWYFNGNVMTIGPSFAEQKGWTVEVEQVDSEHASERGTKRRRSDRLMLLVD